MVARCLTFLCVHVAERPQGPCDQPVHVTRFDRENNLDIETGTQKTSTWT
jgi:hypothetical protein